MHACTGLSGVWLSIIPTYSSTFIPVHQLLIITHLSIHGNYAKWVGNRHFVPTHRCTRSQYLSTVVLGRTTQWIPTVDRKFY
jgi:hypothetical protein